MAEVILKAKLETDVIIKSQKSLTSSLLHIVSILISNFLSRKIIKSSFKVGNMVNIGVRMINIEHMIAPVIVAGPRQLDCLAPGGGSLDSGCLVSRRLH